jgi:type IX secretion system PorP/SprF family membrane protein
MRRSFLIILVLGVGLLPVISNAQQNLVYSQYLFNGLLINPAYAGSHVQLSSALNYRKQWVNFDGAPSTATFGIHSSFKKEKVGLGLLLTNDRIGSYKNTGVFGSYAYIIKMPFGRRLSFGLQGGFNNFNANYSELNLNKGTPDDKFAGTFNELKLNFGGGVFYYGKKIFAGFSVPTMFKHNIFYKKSFTQMVLPRVYYLHAGAMLPLNRMETVKFNPSFLLRVQDGTPLSADFNINFVFYDLISIGNSYRTGDALVTFMSFKLSEKFHFIYSYDWTLSDIGSYSKGTHEFTITYRTRIRQVHKDVECPFFYSH